MKENYISHTETEKSLIVPENENVFTRFFKWIKSIFSKKETRSDYIDENIIINSSIQTYTIPEAVKMPARIEKPEELDENSIEYLYKLDDDELNDLNILYNEQMEEAKAEITKLERIVETYKQTIKKLQGQLSEDNI